MSPDHSGGQSASRLTHADAPHPASPAPQRRSFVFHRHAGSCAQSRQRAAEHAPPLSGAAEADLGGAGAVELEEPDGFGTLVVEVAVVALAEPLVEASPPHAASVMERTIPNGPDAR
jgi:hypothetical protein